MSYLLIGLGGALGSILRFVLSGAVARWVGHAFLGTMFVNVTGSFTIGFIAALSPMKAWEQLLMVGLLGGYTTFSTFEMETLLLAEGGEFLKAALYVVLSVGLGFIAAFGGAYIARNL